MKLFILGLTATFLGYFISSYVLLILWGWFLTPLFGDISYTHALGITLIFNLLKSDVTLTRLEATPRRLGYWFVSSTLVSLLVLFIGWVIINLI